MVIDSDLHIHPGNIYLLNPLRLAIFSIQLVDNDSFLDEKHESKREKSYATDPLIGLIKKYK